jgi:hypothetical protein
VSHRSQAFNVTKQGGIGRPTRRSTESLRGALLKASGRGREQMYRVLIVDDSKLARMTVAKALKAIYPEWQRVEAASADEALS